MADWGGGGGGVGGGGGGGCVTAAYACDTAERRPMTRSGQACDTTRPGLRHRAGCAQAGPRLGALCTRPSF